MKPIYVPILKAKKGEFDALTHLYERASNNAKQIIPWFDVSPIKENIESYLNKTAQNIAKVCEGREIFVDLPRWATNAQTEGGEHIIPYLFNQLECLNVNVNPVVEYVSWDDPIYANAVKNIALEKERSFCIRLNMDIDTVADIFADPDYVSDHILDILNTLELNPAETYLLIDFGDVSGQAHFVSGMIDKAKQAIFLVQEIGFSKVMLAGSSLPPSIELAVKDKNSTGLVLRKEMMTWQTLLLDNPSLNIIFADYGVRNPSSGDESKPYPNANGKLRYTIDKHYFIVRGYALNSGLKYQQFCNLAKIVVNSKHFLSAKFSWGDERILFYSDSECNFGNQTTWIAIDTNHHIETVVMEILEFNRQIAAIKSKE
jgi:hypothetical protein